MRIFVKKQKMAIAFSVLLINAAYVSAQTIFEDFSTQIPPEYIVTDPSQEPDAQTNTADVLFIDIEGDGDMDAYLAEGTNSVAGRVNRMLENDGNAVFTDITATNMPTTSNAPFAPGPSNSQGLATDDIDGDSDADIFIANAGFNELLLNDGNGVFSNASNLLPAPIPDMLYPFSVISTTAKIADFDGDGRLDIIVGYELPPIPPFGPAGLPNHIFMQQSDGTFTDESFARLPQGEVFPTLEIIVFDVENDGDLDIFECNFGQNQLLVNDGNGFFTSETATRLPTLDFRTRAVAIGDLDGDGDPDLVTGNSSDQQNRIYINDGSGVFTDETDTRLPTFLDTTSDAELFDADLDGDLDVIFANASLVFQGPGIPPTPGPTPNALYINDGNGVFTTADDSFLPPSVQTTFGIGIADLNGDGFEDIFISNGVNTEEELLLRTILSEEVIPTLSEWGLIILALLLLNLGVLYIRQTGNVKIVKT